MKRLSGGRRAYLLAHVRRWRPIRAWNVRVFAVLSDGTREEIASTPEARWYSSQVGMKVRQ